MNFTLDQPLVRQLEIGEFDRTVEITNPLGDIVETQPARDPDAGAALLDFRRTAWAGFYEIRPDIAPRPQVFAVNVDTPANGQEVVSGESDLRKIEIAELQELAKGVEFRWYEDPKALHAALVDAGRSSALFRELLVAVLALTLLESLLAWRFGRFK